MAQQPNKYELRERKRYESNSTEPLPENKLLQTTDSTEGETSKDIPQTLSQPPESGHTPDLPSGQNNTREKELLEIPVVNMADFEVVGIDDKLNLLMSAINKINTNFHYKIDNMNKQLLDMNAKYTKTQTKIAEIQTTYEELLGRVDGLENFIPEATDIVTRLERIESAMALIKDDVGVLKGFSQVHDKAITNNKAKIVDLTARSMSNNILISGLAEAEGDDEENSKQKVLAFLKDKMQMEVEEDEVIVAHRIGKTMNKNANPRQMVVRCEYKLRDRIFNYTQHLKDVKNEQGNYYSVQPQLPEPLLSEKRDREDKLRQIRKKNATIPENEKHKRVNAQIRNRTLYINKIPQRSYVNPPTVQEVFDTVLNDQQKMDNMDFVHTNVQTEKGSHFRGHAVRITAAKDVKLAYKKLRTLYPESDHLIMSYLVKSYQGNQDDGEYGASKKILQILNDSGMVNTVLFVTRQYGGIQLGPRRFTFIENVAREALQALQARK